jgi:hypothetical protein
VVVVVGGRGTDAGGRERVVVVVGSLRQWGSVVYRHTGGQE